MKKRILNVIVVCASLVIVSIAGCQRKGDAKKSLPVYENTSIYPEFNFKELVDESAYILKAKVMEVGDAFMNEIPVSHTENPGEASDKLSYPVTPIKLRIEEPVKGNISSGEFIYYEDGGITDTYIISPDGYAMEEGLDVILFLNANGYGWGGQSIYPVVDNHVVLNQAAVKYLGDDMVSSMEVRDIGSNIRSQIDAGKVMVASVGDFISGIHKADNDRIK